MPKKTKSHRKHSRTRKHHCKNPAIIYRQHKSYENMFKKLGWMVLAKFKGVMNDNIISYKKSLKCLEEKIECKIHDVEKR
jgi:hypothetical protein